MTNKPTIIALKQSSITDFEKAKIINSLNNIGYTNVQVHTEAEAQLIYDKDSMDMIICADYQQAIEVIYSISDVLIQKEIAKEVAEIKENPISNSRRFRKTADSKKRSEFKMRIAALRRKK